MTLNQVIRRIDKICIAHKMVRSFYFGLPTDFLNEKKRTYPAALLQDVPGTIDPLQRQRTLSFKLFLLDLVNVSDDTKSNELDVQSDMLGVAEDLLSEINSSSYSDWKLGLSNPVTLVREEMDDMIAGAVIDFSIVTPFTEDTCVVPTETLPT